MATVRSKRLWGPSTCSTVSVLLYTCPAGETALLKHLQVFNQSALSQTFTLGLNGAGANNLIVSVVTAAGLTTQLTGMFVVLHPGDILRGATNQGTATIAGHGAELEGVAD